MRSEEWIQLGVGSVVQDLQSGSVVTNLPANAGVVGWIQWVGKISFREGNGNPLWYSCLGNPRDRGAWRATVHGVAKSQTRLNICALDCAGPKEQQGTKTLKEKGRGPLVKRPSEPLQAVLMSSCSISGIKRTPGGGQLPPWEDQEFRALPFPRSLTSIVTYLRNIYWAISTHPVD